MKIAKLWVDAGALDQEICGETPASVQPQNCCGIGRCAVRSVLVTVSFGSPEGSPERIFWYAKCWLAATAPTVPPINSVSVEADEAVTVPKERA